MKKHLWSIRRPLERLARSISGKTVLPTRFRRHEYKRVWDSVSRTDRDAVRAVAGHTDENLLRTSAEGFVPVLKECVGIHQTDVVLEIGAGVGRLGTVLAPLCREWIGADVSENMVRHISRRLGTIPNAKAVAINGYDLAPIRSESVNLV
jgi:SAM-dependent methyltransferase